MSRSQSAVSSSRVQRPWLWTTGLLSGIVLSGCQGQAESTRTPAGAAALAIDPQASQDETHPGAPPEVCAARHEWPVSNRDYAGTRATVDSRLQRDNIAELRQVWAHDLTLGGLFVGSATAAPIVLNGVVYYVDHLSNVVAIEAESGTLIWQKRYDTLSVGPNGLAVGWGKLFTTSSDRSFVALDLATGEELWQAAIEVPTNGGYSIAPLAWGGLVYLSTVPINATSFYRGGTIGTLYALDHETGAVRWSFATVEDPNLWGNPAINSGGGAWYPPTIDESSGTSYWGIGNPGPFPGTAEFPLGSSRPGPNLYTNSVVSVDALSGTLSWYHQEAPHELFDYDFQNPPVLVDARIDGEQRRLVVGSGKTGTVVALDPARGGAVVWHAAVGRHENDTVTEIDAQGVVQYPGSLGGVPTPIAYAGDTVFVPVVNWGRRVFPASIGQNETAIGTGELVALDASNGVARWTAELPNAPFASVTVVNDLVLAPTFDDARIHAFDRETGEEVWTWQAPLALNAPITVAGDTLYIPAAGCALGATCPETPQLIALRLPD